MSCAHGFVVPNDGGFLCRECDEQFAHYPREGGTGEVFESATRSETLYKFHEGMITFSHAIKETQLSLDAFTQAMQRMYPPKEITDDVRTIGSIGVKKIVVGYTPTRHSCFKDVDGWINDPDTTVTEIQDIMTHFSDITEVEYIHHAVVDSETVIITFVDDSKQRVDVHMPRLLKRPANGTRVSRFIPNSTNIFTRHQ